MALAPPDPHGRASHPASSPPTPRRIGSVRDGDLDVSWRLVLGVAWVLAFFAYAAVWQVSVQIGIGTWWLGPRAQPTEVWVRIIPFVLPLLVSLALVYDVRRPVRICVLASLMCALIAAPDFERSIPLGLLELAIAVLLFAVSIAASTGRFRIPR